jgi:hypothetical protein
MRERMQLPGRMLVFEAAEAAEAAEAVAIRWAAIAGLLAAAAVLAALWA